ncbi:MAG: HAMP domain-containing protein [Gammaproteobacteria bacterium]|nr:HAMP domain-containing protein [Gammaproteobacteria bacterium]
MARPKPTYGITDRTLRQVALRICIVVVIATVIGYWHVRAGLEDHGLRDLQRYVRERQSRESTVFELAAEDLSAFAAEYRYRLPACLTPLAEQLFDSMFVADPEGGFRTRPQLYQRLSISGHIGTGVSIDESLKCRLFTAYDLLRQFGPAWQRRFENLYVVTPEGAVLMYWPGQRWALSASSWEIATKIGHLRGSGDARSGATPGFRQHWSSLYFDYSIGDWLVSATEEVRDEGQSMLVVGHDVPLKELIQRTLEPWRPGTENMVVRADGLLIAHPRYMREIQASSGRLRVQDTDDAPLLRAFRSARRASPEQLIVDNQVDGEYLAVTRIAGPDWYLLTRFPKSLVSAQAIDLARLLLVLGGLVLLVELVILYRILTRQVAQPLATLTRATERVAYGRYDAPLDTERADELGTLARAVSTMSREVDARQAALNAQNQELADLSSQLRRELSQRKRAEAELESQREALHKSEKLNALGSLLAGVAHELNNPLSVVVGRAGMLQEQLRGTPSERSIEKLRNAAERCARIVKSFLAMAREDAHRREPVEPVPLIRASLEAVADSLAADLVQVHVRADGPLPMIYADPDQLLQVLTNVLLNACQALGARAGDRQILIQVEHLQGRGCVSIRVQDNGPGIPQGELRRIFDPFFTTKPVGEGTGLGLSVSLALVQAHGGTMTASNTSDGACVEIVMPIASTQRDVLPSPDDALAGVPGAQSRNAGTLTHEAGDRAHGLVDRI